LNIKTIFFGGTLFPKDISIIKIVPTEGFSPKSVCLKVLLDDDIKRGMYPELLNGYINIFGIAIRDILSEAL